jgi:hypothetical protein
MIVWGSLSLAQTLINEKLVDGNLQPFNLKLSDAKPLDRGAVLLKYLSANP